MKFLLDNEWFERRFTISVINNYFFTILVGTFKTRFSIFL